MKRWNFYRKYLYRIYFSFLFSFTPQKPKPKVNTTVLHSQRVELDSDEEAMRNSPKLGGSSEIKVEADIHAKEGKGGFGIKIPKFGRGGRSSSSSSSEDESGRKKGKGTKLDASGKLTASGKVAPGNANFDSAVSVPAGDPKVQGDISAKGRVAVSPPTVHKEDSKGFGINIKMPKFGKGGSHSDEEKKDNIDKKVKGNVDFDVKAGLKGDPPKVGKVEDKGKVDISMSSPTIERKGEIKPEAKAQALGKVETDISMKGKMEAAGKPEAKGGFGIKMPKFGKSGGGSSSSSSSSEDDGTGKRVKKVKGPKLEGGAKIGVNVDVDAKGSKKPLPSPQLEPPSAKVDTGMKAGFSAGGDTSVKGKGDLDFSKPDVKLDASAHKPEAKGGFGIKIPKFGKSGGGSSSSSSSEDDGTGKRVKKVKGPKLGVDAKIGKPEAKVDVDVKAVKKPLPSPHAEIPSAKVDRDLKAGFGGGKVESDASLKGKADIKPEIKAEANLNKPEAKGGFGIKMPKFGKGGGGGSSSSDDDSNKNKKKGAKMEIDIDVGGKSKTKPLPSPHLDTGAKVDLDAKSGTKQLPTLNVDTKGGAKVDFDIKGGAKADVDLKSGGKTPKGEAAITKSDSKGGFGFKIPKFGRGGGSDSSSDDEKKKVKGDLKVDVDLKAGGKLDSPKVEAKSAKLGASPPKVEAKSPSIEKVELGTSGKFKMPKFGGNGSDSSSSDDEKKKSKGGFDIDIKGGAKGAKPLPKPEVDIKNSGDIKGGISVDTKGKAGGKPLPSPKLDEDVNLKAKGLDAGKAKLDVDLKGSGKMEGEAEGKSKFGIKMPKFGRGGNSSSSSDDEKKAKGKLKADVSINTPGLKSDSSVRSPKMEPMKGGAQVDVPPLSPKAEAALGMKLDASLSSPKDAKGKHLEGEAKLGTSCKWQF